MLDPQDIVIDGLNNGTDPKETTYVHLPLTRFQGDCQLLPHQLTEFV